MKALIISAGSVLFILFWFYIGTFLFPFVAWMTKWEMYAVPSVLFGIFLGLLWIHVLVCAPAILYKKRRVRNMMYVLSVFPPLALFHLGWLVKKKYYWPLVWMPFLCSSILSVGYLNNRYGSMGTFRGDYIRFKSLSGDYGIANKYGNVVLGADYSEVRVRRNGNAVLYGQNNGESGLYSINEGRMLVPMGYTLKTFCTVEESGGMKGLVSKAGDVIVPFVYDVIKVCEAGIIVSKSGKYGMLDEWGQYEKIDIEYDDYSIEESIEDKYYYVFYKDGGATVFDGYGLVEARFKNCRWISEIIDDERPMLFHKNGNGKWDECVVDEDGQEIIRSAQYFTLCYEKDRKVFVTDDGEFDREGRRK